MVERVVASVAEDPKRLVALQELAERFTTDVAVLRQQLERAAVDATGATRGPAAVLEERTRVLYGILIAVPDGHYLMKEKEIISPGLYWFYVRGLNSIIKIVGVVTVAIAVILANILYFYPKANEYLTTYYVWRVGKTSATSLDQFRARQHLLVLMRDQDPDIKQSATTQLAMLVRQPGLPMERVDLALQVLLENRGLFPGKLELPPLLVQSLRSISVDARMRVNDALKFLADYCKDAPGDDLSGWKPNEGDSTAKLEMKIKTWEEYWSKPCMKRAP
jgi:hypothetical protein